MAKEAKLAKAGLPAGVKIIDGKEEMALDAATIRKVMEGWEVKKIIDDAKARLDAINQELVEAHGTGVALVVTGICRASLASRQQVKIKDADRLEAVLGDRFKDLVRESVSYTAEPKLVEMACDADEPLQPAVAACLFVSEGRSVTWRAEK
ncbi:MAG: hypothetical protein N2690_00370 [Rhodocyclaceae bacterium]|nr:hypothetical protein [Rhodocyclaceae bacterium]